MHSTRSKAIPFVSSVRTSMPSPERETSMQKLNPKPNASSESTAKSKSKFLTELITQLAMGLNHELSRERVTLYLFALGDLDEQRLRFAFNQAIRRCEFFPTPAKLREFANEYRPPIDEVQALRNRGDKPPGWRPLSREELDAIYERFLHRKPSTAQENS